MANLTPVRLRDGAPGRAKTGVEVNVQAAIGGWNTRDSFDDIPPTDAIVMDNWIPGLGALEVRKGTNYEFDSQSIGGGGEVKTLMTFEDGSNLRLLGADSGLVYDVTTATLLGSGFGSDYWIWTNFDGKLIMCNGVDLPQEYDGTTLQPLTVPLSGIPTNPIGCMTFKNRMYYWEAVSQDVYYTELYAAGGTVTKFALSMLTQFGGRLVTTETWTHDGGSGPDDFIVFIMSAGETIVYQGSSPASVANWALVGVYNIGQPLGPRCSVKFGGELLLMTTLDIVPMSKILAGAEGLAVRSKISGAMQNVALLYGSDLFDAIIHPAGTIAIFNVPDPEKTIVQFAMNLITGAWCRLVDMKAYSWANLGEKIYFGSDDGVVYQAFNLEYDERYEDPGTGWQVVNHGIKGDLQTAWLTFGAITNKLLNAMKPILRGTAPIEYDYEIAVDFGGFSSVGYPPAIRTGGTPWGSPWGSPWGLAITIDEDWEIIEGYGRYASLYFRTNTMNALQWGSTVWLIGAGTRL